MPSSIGGGASTGDADSLVTPPNSITTVVDTGQMRNVASRSANTTFTFSATPTSGQFFGLDLTNSDAAAITITIPSSFSISNQTSITSFLLAGLQRVWLVWYYNGSSYFLTGAPNNNVVITGATTGDGSLSVVSYKESGTIHSVQAADADFDGQIAALFNSASACMYRVMEDGEVRFAQGTQTTSRNNLSAADLVPYFIQCTNFDPTDALTYFVGAMPVAPDTTAARTKIRVHATGVITGCDIQCYAFGVAGSNEAWSFYLRLNDTTDTLIATVSAATNERVFTNRAMSIAVTAEDSIQLKMVCPTWGTNPTTVRVSGNFFLRVGTPAYAAI